MEKEQALQIMEQALNIAVGKNIFKVEDSAVIFTAFAVVKNTLTESVEEKEIKDEEVKTKSKK